MLHVLLEVEDELLTHLTAGLIGLKSMFIDYHEPYVSRVWFQLDEYRIYLHKIEPCTSTADALYHPHPWKSAIRILRGTYEMGVGHSTTNEIPVTDCKLLLNSGAAYEMNEKDAWHYVNPIGSPVYSLMVTGERNFRQMPVEPNKDFRKLTAEEITDILSVVEAYYGFALPKQEICKVIE